MDNVIQFILVFISYAILIFAIRQFGVYGLIALAKEATYRVQHGKPKLPERTKDCRVLHRTAATELELYGRVKSPSVCSHVHACSKYKIYPEKGGHYMIKLTPEYAHKMNYISRADTRIPEPKRTERR